MFITAGYLVLVRITSDNKIWIFAKNFDLLSQQCKLLKLVILIVGGYWTHTPFLHQNIFKNYLQSVAMQMLTNPVDIFYNSISPSLTIKPGCAGQHANKSHAKRFSYENHTNPFKNYFYNVLITAKLSLLVFCHPVFISCLCDVAQCFCFLCFLLLIKLHARHFTTFTANYKCQA